jgi:hypothetical protein
MVPPVAVVIPKHSAIIALVNPEVYKGQVVSDDAACFVDPDFTSQFSVSTPARNVVYFVNDLDPALRRHDAFYYVWCYTQARDLELRPGTQSHLYNEMHCKPRRFPPVPAAQVEEAPGEKVL